MRCACAQALARYGDCSYNRRSMSLITRCPSCATQFRVVADQLRISEGWVRCGRCQEVFDATQALQSSAPVTAPQTDVQAPVAAQPDTEHTLASPAPSTAPASSPSFAKESVTDWPWSAPSTPAEAAPLARAPSLPVHPQAAQSPAEVEAADIPHSGYELPSPPEPVEPVLPLEEPWHAGALEIPRELDAEPALADAWLSSPVNPARDGDVAPASVTADAELRQAPSWEPVKPLPAEDEQALQWSQAWLAVKTVPAAALPESEDGLKDEPAGELQPAPMPDMVQSPASADAIQSDADEAVPSFVKQAQRKAWWSQPAVRFVMGMLVTLLPLALLLQIAIHERNQLVAWKPQWRPALHAMCVALRCELAPRQHIASVVLTGSSFNQDAQPYHYRLGLSMQNQSGASVATPAVELTLTDMQGQTLVRKVLLPTEIGAPVELAAHSEWNGSLPVATQGLQLPVSGYRVLAFYP